METLDSNEFPGQPISIEFAWPDSKEYLSHLINHMVNQVGAGDLNFREKYGRRGAYLSGLFYDFGHTGRSFDDFSKSIKITGWEIEREGEEGDRQAITLHISISELLKTLTEQIAEFLRAHKLYKNDRSKEYFEEQIAMLEAMVSYLSQLNWKGTVKLESHLGNGVFEITEVNYPL